MSSPYLGEIRMVSFKFATRGFAFCNGQSLPVQQNSALFSLLGITFGGDGQNTFKLPNLQGCSALHSGSGFSLGQAGGEAAHTLAISEMPGHNHPVYASNSGGLSTAAGNLPGSGINTAIYDPSGGANASMNNGVIGNAGGNQAHENRMPFLAINFIIALQGIYPSRS